MPMTYKIDHIALFTIYGTTTTDYPGKYVVRRSVVHTDHVEQDLKPIAITNTLEEARDSLPRDLYNLGRMRSDDPVIVETWI